MENEVKKILFVGEYDYIVGGIERYMFKSAELLRTSFGCSVDLLPLEAQKSIPSGDPDFLAAFSRVLSLEQLRVIRDEYDLIVIHKLRDGRVVDLLRRHGKRVALFVHDHENYCPRRSYYHPVSCKNCSRAYSYWLCTWCGSAKRQMNLFYNMFGFPCCYHKLKSVDFFIVISDFMRQCLTKNKIPLQKIVKIQPYIPLPELLPEENEPLIFPPHILSLGQLIKGKGVDQLIAAAGQVPQPCVVDILGRGGAESSLRRQAEEDERIRFHQWSARPEEFLRRAYCVALPWRWQEPFGLVGPEALAYGLPLVGFDVGGIREYLIDGVSGILVPEGDIDAFGTALSRLLSDNNLARKLGENGRRLVAEKYSLAAAEGGWQNIFRWGI
ncbi:MAG: glycosyltransferase family 4 protein [Victivallaceae bacterium]